MGMHEGGKIAVGCVTWDQFKVGPKPFVTNGLKNLGFLGVISADTYRVNTGISGGPPWWDYGKYW